MSFRLILVCLAIFVCALWPQGLVLCVGDRGHIDLEPGGAPCCPEERHEDEENDDCGGCRDFESPELASAIAAPVLPAPIAAASAPQLTSPDALATASSFDAPPRHRNEAGLLTVVLVV